MPKLATVAKSDGSKTSPDPVLTEVRRLKSDADEIDARIAEFQAETAQQQRDRQEHDRWERAKRLYSRFWKYPH